VVDVVVVGSLNIDMITRVDRLPGAGETVLGGDLVLRPGGKGANQALAAAKAGAPTRLYGRVGADALGVAYRAELGRRGVDPSGVLITPDVATGRAFIAVAADGENQIVVVPGANGRMTESDVDIVAPLLLVQLELPLAVVLTAARQADRLILNASPVRELPDALLARADPLVVNRHEASLLAGSASDQAGRLHARGVRSLVITLGEAGAVVSTQEGSTRVAAPTVDVVDTTGAGDAFAGTLAARLAAGASLLEAVRPAVEAASRAATVEGAQDWTFPEAMGS
jgi:ribokinase